MQGPFCTKIVVSISRPMRVIVSTLREWISAVCLKPCSYFFARAMGKRAEEKKHADVLKLFDAYMAHLRRLNVATAQANPGRTSRTSLTSGSRQHVTIYGGGQGGRARGARARP